MSAPTLCPVIGEKVHERDVVASLTYCPECSQLVAVFKTSEPRPYCYRMVRHEVIR